MSNKYQMTGAAARRIIAGMMDDGITSWSYEIVCERIRREGFPQPRTRYADFIRALADSGQAEIAIGLGEAAARAAAYAHDDLDAVSDAFRRLGFVTTDDEE